MQILSRLNLDYVTEYQPTFGYYREFPDAISIREITRRLLFDEYDEKDMIWKDVQLVVIQRMVNNTTYHEFEIAWDLLDKINVEFDMVSRVTFSEFQYCRVLLAKLFLLLPYVFKTDVSSEGWCCSVGLNLLIAQLERGYYGNTWELHHDIRMIGEDRMDRNIGHECFASILINLHSDDDDVNQIINLEQVIINTTTKLNVV